MKISHSQIETLEQCEQKKLLGYQHKPQAPSEILIMGRGFHEATEADGRKRMQGGAYSLFQLLQIGLEAMAKDLAKSDPLGLLATKKDNMRARLMASLSAYHEKVAPNYHPLAVEQNMQWKRELYVPDSDERLYYGGRIDAITDKAIVDFKTANDPWQVKLDKENFWSQKRKEPTLTMQEWLDHKDQATAYLIGRPEQKKVVFIVFATNPATPDVCEVGVHATTRTDEQKAAYVEKVVGLSSRIKEIKKTGVARASLSPLCGYCGFLGSCPLGQAWLKAAGREPSVPVVTEHDAPASSDDEEAA